MLRDIYVVVLTLVVLGVLIEAGLNGHGAHSGGVRHLAITLGEAAAIGFCAIQIDRWFRR